MGKDKVPCQCEFCRSQRAEAIGVEEVQAAKANPNHLGVDANGAPVEA